MAEQLLAVEAGGIQVGVIADRQVDLAVLHRLHQLARRERHRIEHGQRREPAHAVEDPRQEDQFAHVSRARR